MLLAQDSHKAEQETREQLDALIDNDSKEDCSTFNLSRIVEEDEVAESAYEAFDKFDFDDKMIGEIGKVSDNRIIEAAYQSLVRLHKIQDNITQTD